MENETQQFSPLLKDILCRVYNFIDKYKDDPSVPVDFTENGVVYAYNRKTSGVNAQKWANRFLSLQDQIKELSENQPTKTIKFFTKWEDNGEQKERSETRTFKTYDIEEMNYFIGLKAKRYQEQMVVESNF